MHKKIIEITSIQEILKHLDPNTHFFFDIDNTLLMPKQDFGSEHWENFLFRHFLAEGVPEEDAFNRASDIWKAIQTVSEIRFVEPQTLKVVQTLREHGCPVFAITARSVELRRVTQGQLAHLGIEFCHSEKDYILEKPVAFSNGVFFCSGFNKGQAIRSYVDVHQCSKIVMVDDNIVHLENAVKALEIEFTGLRYGYLDHHKKKYVPDSVSTLLYKVFNHPEACKFLKKGLIQE